MQLTKKTISFLLIILVMIVWGSAFAVTKVAVQEIPPFSFALLRFVVALAGLAIFKILSQRPVHKTAGKKRLYTFLMGIFGITLYYGFFNLALQETPASVGALIQGFIPACTALFAVLFLKEKIGHKQVFGIALSLAGVIILGWDSSKSGGASWYGILLMGCSVIAWAAYTIFSKKVSDSDSFSTTFYTMIVGCVFLVPFASTEISKIDWQAVSTQSYLSIFYLGLIGSALCYFLYNKVLETLSATQVGNFMNLDPIVGVVIALIFLNEKLGTVQIMGGILVVAGIVLSSFTRPKTINR